MEASKLITRIIYILAAIPFVKTVQAKINLTHTYNNFEKIINKQDNLINLKLNSILGENESTESTTSNFDIDSNNVNFVPFERLATNSPNKFTGFGSI